MKPHASPTIPIMVGLLMAYFMALLDATIVNISLPEIAQHFHSSLGGISWVMNGYNLAFAVFILAASKLADRFGRKRLFLIGTLGFTLSSLAAGLAPSLEVLVAARVVQGLCAAIMVPVTIPLALAVIPPAKSGIVYGIWGAVAGLAAASGPLLGGILTQSFGWQAIFYVNIPLGAVSLVISGAMLKESRADQGAGPLDMVGILSISAGLFCLVWALLHANTDGWTSMGILGLFAASAIFLLFFGIRESRSTEPMVPRGLVAIPTFRWSLALLAVNGFVIIGAVFLVSFWLRVVLQMDNLGAGLTVSIMPLVSMVFAVVAGPRASQGDARPWLAAGTALLALGAWLLSLLGVDSTQADVLWRLAICGAGVGLSITPAFGAALKGIPRSASGMASGSVNMSRALGGVVGVAVLVAVLTAGLGPMAIGGDATNPTKAVNEAFAMAFRVCAGAAFLSLIFVPATDTRRRRVEVQEPLGGLNTPG